MTQFLKTLIAHIISFCIRQVFIHLINSKQKTWIRFAAKSCKFFAFGIRNHIKRCHFKFGQAVERMIVNLKFLQITFCREHHYHY